MDASTSAIEMTRPEPAADAAVPSWKALYEAHGERVFRFLVRMTRNPDLAADLTHDVFVRAHERRHQYAGRGTVRSWVFQIAANLVRDRARRRSFRDGQLPALRRRQQPVRSTTELGLALRRALDTLPDGQREVVLLHDVDGFTHREIGELLEIAEGTSRARLSHGRAALREVLARIPTSEGAGSPATATSRSTGPTTTSADDIDPGEIGANAIDASDVDPSDNDTNEVTT